MLKRIARQFRQPSGFAGRLLGRIMNRSNADMIAGSIDRLGAAPDHRLLEIGFGGGLGLQLLLDTVSQGSVTGTELSDVMISQAERRFAEAISAGRLELVLSPIERLSLDDAAFDGAISINTVYFWTDPGQGLSEILRILKPGVPFVLGIRPPALMKRLPTTRHGFMLYEPAQLEDMLSQAGFTDARSKTNKDGRLAYICVTARKPETSSGG